MAVVIKSHKETDLFASFTGEFFSQFIRGNNGNDPISPWRKASFARALSTPAPSNRDEDFKYVNFRLLDFDGLKPIRLHSMGDDNGKPSTILRMGLDKSDSLPDRFKVAADADEDDSNLFFGSFFEAAIAMPQELANNLEFFNDRFPHRKFAHLAHAFLSQGAFLHVGKNGELRSPRQLLTRVGGENAMTSYCTLIVLEENSRANLVWDIDAKPTASGLVNSTLGVVLRTGSRMNLLVNQELNSRINSVTTMRVYLEKDAEAELATMNSGGRLNQMEIDLQFGGEGAKATVNGIYIGRNDENFNLLTHQDHRFGHSTSDLLYVGTLAGRSKSNYLGKITIAPNTKRSDAYQKNRNLVLNKGVAVNSSPKLEICANDVRCTHGATTSKVSDLEMFYLRSRGIDKVTAKVLLAEGFLGQVAERLKSPVLRHGFEQRLDALLSQWGENEK